MLNDDTPEKLVEAWLEFHRSNLCQSMDAVFVFNRQGVEIWCVGKDERKHRKLQQIFAPLQSSYKVEMYATRPPIRDDSNEDPAPPPSLCENYELRMYLRDPLVQFREIMEGVDLNKNIAPPDLVLRQRLIVYAEDVLEESVRMQQYAADLPELVAAARNPAFKQDLRAQAGAVCAGHAKELTGAIRRLIKNLTYAFPKPRKAASVVKEEEEKHAKLTLAESSELIAAAAKESTERIHRFIYPRQHTVELDDLRKPSILASLRNLEVMAIHFHKESAKLSGRSPARQVK